MRIKPTLLIAGVTAIALAGVAAATIHNTHVMTVRLPGGGVETIAYTGKVPPTVSIAPPALVGPVAWAGAPFAMDAPFAMMGRISAEMDRETAAMFARAEALDASGAGPRPVDLATLPAGARGYTFVSTLSGHGVCSRSVEITSAGDGSRPNVITRTSGDCGRPADRTASTVSPPGQARDGLITASYRPSGAAPAGSTL